MGEEKNGIEETQKWNTLLGELLLFITFNSGQPVVFTFMEFSFSLYMGKRPLESNIMILTRGSGEVVCTC